MKKGIFAVIALGTIMLSAFTKENVKSENKATAQAHQVKLVNAEFIRESIPATLSNLSKANLSQADGGDQ